MARPRADTVQGETPVRILVAAEEEFGRSGYEGTHLQEIASAVGISRPSLLYHYGTKEELYAAVVQRAFVALGNALSGAMGGEGAFEVRFDRVVRRFLLHLEESPPFARLMLRELLDGRGPGQSLLLEAGIPVLERIEKFVKDEGRGVVRPRLHVRTALLSIVSAALVRSASGALRGPLWGAHDQLPGVARALFFFPDKEADTCKS